MKSRAIVVMGVSGAGKSTLAQALGAQLGFAYLDADNLHSPENLAKMSKGVPLTDFDRWPWLALVGEELSRNSETGAVMACSALKLSYRDLIRGHCPSAFFIELRLDEPLALARLTNRKGHFLGTALLKSQLSSLEPLSEKEPGLSVDASLSVQDLIEKIASYNDAEHGH